MSKYNLTFGFNTQLALAGNVLGLGEEAEFEKLNCQ